MKDDTPPGAALEQDEKGEKTKANIKVGRANHPVSEATVVGGGIAGAGASSVEMQDLPSSKSLQSLTALHSAESKEL